MKTPWPMILIAAISLGMGACNRDHDTGARNETTAPAEQPPPPDTSATPPAPAPEGSMSSGSTTGDTREIQIAKAESDHQAALQRCDSLPADAQQSCKDQADAALEAAKDQAESTPPQGQ